MIHKYLSVMAALDISILAGTIISHSNTKAGFFNPPLGAADNFILPTCLAAGICLTTIGPLMVRKRASLQRLFHLGFVTIVFFVLGYGWAVQRYGRPIEISARGISDFVIVGTERTPFAIDNFPADSDVTMLEKRGWSEDDIALYWTRYTLNRSRTIIMLTFVGALISFNLIVASVAAQYYGPRASRRVAHPKFLKS
jgi:hypothetical protein